MDFPSIWVCDLEDESLNYKTLRWNWGTSNHLSEKIKSLKNNDISTSSLRRFQVKSERNRVVYSNVWGAVCNVMCDKDTMVKL